MLPPQHSNYGVAERRVWRTGWGCGLPEPLGICVAGYPDINPYVPTLCGATPGRTSRATRTASPQAAGYPVHVWGCRCIPGTMTCRRFKDRMISKISEIDREHPWTTRQLFNSITLGHNSDPTLQIISWEGFCQA
jgi:hypothetical protein